LRKITVILVKFYLTVTFLDRWSKHTRLSNLMKIREVEAELFHAHGRTDDHTDMMVLIVTICNFANEPKKRTETGTETGRNSLQSSLFQTSKFNRNRRFC
jgi:hypothetical protein